MPEPLAPPPGDPLTYRPLSGFAVAGFVLSLLTALVVLVSGGIALAQGVPVFFPAWFVALLAGGGLALSLVGLNEINQSEGTRAGLKLARAGLWVGLVTGLGYFAYYQVTSLAVTRQANDFLLDKEAGFFAHLRKGVSDPVALNRAFLLTLPATSRGAVKPTDEEALAQTYDQPTPDGGAGPRSMFRDHFLTRVFRTAPAETTVEPLGVQSWNYEGRSYKVVRNYRLRTPEADVDLVLPVQSTEGEVAGQARQWFFLMKEMHTPATRYTPLGDGLNQLRGQARVFLEVWKKRLDAGQRLPPLGPLDRTDWVQVIPADADRTEARQRLAAFFDKTAKQRGGTLSFGMPYQLGGWTVADGRVELAHPLRVMLPTDAEGKTVALYEGQLLTRTRGPVNPLQPGEPPDWEISGITFTRVATGDARKLASPF